MTTRFDFDRPSASRLLREDFAKTEIYLMDLETKKIVHHPGPVEGAAYRRSKTFFFFIETRKGDTTRLE